MQIPREQEREPLVPLLAGTNVSAEVIRPGPGAVAQNLRGADHCVVHVLVPAGTPGKVASPVSSRDSPPLVPMGMGQARSTGIDQTNRRQASISSLNADSKSSASADGR